MKLHFQKMDGAGNDFICLDNRTGNIQLTKTQRAHLCNRHSGIGADGLLLVEKNKSKETDFSMRYFNSDGGEASMCGNGARCFSRFANALLPKPKTSLAFDTKAGVVRAEFLSNHDVSIALTPPKNLQIDIPLKIEYETKQKPIEVRMHSIDTGVPHAVVFVSDIELFPVFEMGRLIRQHDFFKPAGTNVNFVQILKKNTIRVRTYERGVENETLACGTGVTASALISSLFFDCTGKVKAVVQSGKACYVQHDHLDGTFQNVRLSGPADFTYQGEINV